MARQISSWPCTGPSVASSQWHGFYALSGGDKIPTLSLADDPLAAHGLRDLTPRELAQACVALRNFFSERGFIEVVLSPLDEHITLHPDSWPVTAGRQPRFNTEPEIWASWNGSDPFFAITPLFRIERQYNIFRRPAFHILDFFVATPVEALLSFFQDITKHLGDSGILHVVHHLGFEHVQFNSKTDLPETSNLERRLLVASGYGPENSFFELDSRGQSTRKEIFLASEWGVLELAAIGIAGENRNPAYGLKDASLIPPWGLAGIGIGLERLLLGDRLLGG